MELLSITEIWRWLRWLPPFVLRRIFNKTRLADIVLLDVRARHRSVLVNLSGPPSYEIYFQVINMSPFEVELDRAEFDFQVNGARIRSQYIKKVRYKAGEMGLLYINGEISEANANHIAKYANDGRESITVHCEFNCRLHSFTKTLLTLEGLHVEYINRDWRKSQLVDRK